MFKPNKSVFNTACITIMPSEQKAAILYFASAALLTVFVTFAYRRNGPKYIAPPNGKKEKNIFIHF